MRCTRGGSTRPSVAMMRASARRFPCRALVATLAVSGFPPRSGLMDLKQIQYFIALFEDGSVTRAAKRLNIVQPALSMQISKLEAELRQTLFERGPHGMTPTEAARLMYRLYTPIMRDIDHAREQLSRRDVIIT